jgi:protocatechuate 3,4-dioxygenase beta subunit
MEKIVKPDTPSLRRRQLMIAGIAAPAALFAPQLRAALTAELPASARRKVETLIVSGRMVNSHGKPLAGALVEVLDSGSKAGASATTDADGRFLFTSVVPRETLNYRVSREGHGTVVKQLHFAHKPSVAGDQVAQLQRDDAGAWRTTFGLTLA